MNHNFSATAMKEIIIRDHCTIGNNCVIVDRDHAVVPHDVKAGILVAGISMRFAKNIE